MFNLTIILGKIAQKLAKLKGGGSALPGLIIEKINPNFLQQVLSQLPYGVAIVSGTNGKTTTTKMVARILEDQGLRVFTNKTGSNFIRGVISSILGKIKLTGKLEADIAVLELDEAHAVQFIKKVKPSHSLILNVMRDQLDRFGEIDKTAELLDKVCQATIKSVTLNREDPLIANLAKNLKHQKINFFGLDKKLIKYFPNDDCLHGQKDVDKNNQPADTILLNFKNNQASFLVGETELTTKLKLKGIYNIYNASAAIAFTRAILGRRADNDKIIKSLEQVTPAFGRGEELIINNKKLEIILVKNPAGFRLSLESFETKGWETMLAINDLVADGRDMSWLWDVDFTSLKECGVTMVSGLRAYDMALRLKYDEVLSDKIETDIKLALDDFINKSNQPKRIYCTYTAMLAVRQYLSKIIYMEKYE